MPKALNPGVGFGRANLTLIIKGIIQSLFHPGLVALNSDPSGSNSSSILSRDTNHVIFIFTKSDILNFESLNDLTN